MSEDQRFVKQPLSPCSAFPEKRQEAESGIMQASSFEAVISNSEMKKSKTEIQERPEGKRKIRRMNEI
jgi:hypothetical protein